MQVRMILNNILKMKTILKIGFNWIWYLLRGCKWQWSEQRGSTETRFKKYHIIVYKYGFIKLLDIHTVLCLYIFHLQKKVLQFISNYIPKLDIYTRGSGRYCYYAQIREWKVTMYVPMKSILSGHQDYLQLQHMDIKIILNPYG